MDAMRVLVFALLMVGQSVAQGGPRVASVPQEGGNKRPSLAGQAQCKFSDGNTITVDYSSPRMRGQKIFGGLVP